MNPDVGRLLQALRETNVELKSRRSWAGQYPPGFMEDVTFTFNGHRDLASHSQALSSALKAAEDHLIQSLLYHEERHQMSWEEGQILLISLAATDSKLASNGDGVLIHANIKGPSEKLDVEQWQALEDYTRHFIAQQQVVCSQLKSIVESLRPEFDSLSRGITPRVNKWKWMGTDVQLLELFYALTQVGALVWMGDKLPLEEMAGEFAHLFRTEVRHVDSTISRMLKRQTGPAKFMMQCAQHLERVREMREA